MRRTLPAFVWKICAAALMIAAFNAPQVRAQTTPRYPAWWANQGVLSGTAAPNDFAAANQGQAKNMAGGAVKELDTDLRQFGGAGSQLDQLMATLSGTTAQTDDYLAINLGQLKAILQPFYDRLLAVGYTGTSGPLSTGTYPWIGAGKVANDYAWANLGQLKNLFSFDVKYSSSGGTIPDWWIEKYFPGSTQNGEPSINPSGYVAWSDTVTYLQAYQQGLDPTDPYGGTSPTLTALNWGIITAQYPGDSSDITVQVTDASGVPIPGAPVTFSIDNGLLMAPGASVSSISQTVQVTSDADGDATVSVIMPWWPDTSVTVTATAETAGESDSVQFTGLTWSNNPTAPPLPAVQTPTPVNEPALSVAISSTSVANPAFRQFTDTQPIQWYLVSTESSNYTSILSEGGTSTFTGTYSSVGTEQPLFGGRTWNGSSEQTLNETLPPDGAIWDGYDATAYQFSDGSWSADIIVSSTGGAYPYNDPPWIPLDYRPSPNISTIESETEKDLEDSEASQGYSVNFSDITTLSNAYTGFTTDVYNTLQSPSSYYDGYDSGDTIAWRELADDSSSFSIGEATYKFKCASTGTAPYVFEWYEVFQPDDDTQPVQVSSKKEWDYANQQAESPPFTINPSTSGTVNGTWYIARLDTQTNSACPECAWRHVLGVGEIVTLRLQGLPDSVTQSVQWSVSGTAGELTKAAGPVTTFTAGIAPGNVTITATLPGGAIMQTTFTVEAPTGINILKIASIPIPWWGEGAGMWCQYSFLPTNVSFSGCYYEERECPASNTSGYFAAHGAPIHNPNPNGGNPSDSNWIGIQVDNTADTPDHAEAGPISIGHSAWWADLFPEGSGFSWNIPVLYKRKDDSDNTAIQLQTVTQTMYIGVGSCGVQKGSAEEEDNN